MQLRLIRHATLILDYAGHTLIVDPMLDEVGARPAIQHSPNPQPNPLVPLPTPVEQFLPRVEAVLVTHTHSDHWDSSAARLLNKTLPLFCQPEDERNFRDRGFTLVQCIQQQVEWNGIQIFRTGGQHGKGEVGRRMAPVSGFVLRSAAEPTVYIAGDTIWCAEVRQAIEDFHPSTIVVNAGAAQFLEGGAITMTAEDVIEVCKAAPQSQVVAVHMEAINHCLLTRSDLAFQLEAARLGDRVVIPNDGDETRR
jgi:L-ascorbate metabolism protein UlaG (beta-lactamase superfamily)